MEYQLTWVNHHKHYLPNYLGFMVEVLLYATTGYMISHCSLSALILRDRQVCEEKITTRGNWFCLPATALAKQGARALRVQKEARVSKMWVFV